MAISTLTEILEQQRHRLLLWAPVFFGVGIAVYFGGATEPSSVKSVAIAMFALVCSTLIRPRQLIRSVLLGMAMLSSLGYSYAAYRTAATEAPVLSRHYYGPIYGRVIGLDRSASNAPRALLDQVYIPGILPVDTPRRVRMSLQGYIHDSALVAGGRVAMTGSLSPPSPPVEPDGFDFRRMAWFMTLGAVGYTRNPVIPSEPNMAPDFRVWLFSLRMEISKIIKSKIVGQNGSFASAIITGDRSEIDPAILDDLRASNLAHLLAISGLHMGLLSGFVFALLRYGLALIPFLALRVRPKKLAAGLAILAGAVYLMLSGASVATQRAFIMTAVVLFAVILDRPAFTLRAVALAAFIVLIIKPYSLLEAGFQMSFAATTALIAAYEWFNRLEIWHKLSSSRWSFTKPAIALLFTSAVAGIATAPISAFHFNQISQYGLAANMFAVPVMGMVVMPSAVLAALLTPVGLDWIAFSVMGKGIGYILAVSDYFANLEGAITTIKSAPPMMLGGIIFGGLILLLWQGRGRLVGVLVLLTTFLLWSNTPRPLVFISDEGRMFGVMTSQGRVVNKPRGSGYAVRIWLENDGDQTAQAEAFERDGVRGDETLALIDITDDWQVAIYSGEDMEIAKANCLEYTILVLPKLTKITGDCIIVDKNYLRNSGAIAVDIVERAPVFRHSRDVARHRPWGR